MAAFGLILKASTRVRMPVLARSSKWAWEASGVLRHPSYCLKETTGVFQRGLKLLAPYVGEAPAHSESRVGALDVP